MTLAQTWKQQKDKAEKILTDAKKSGIEKTGQFPKFKDDFQKNLDKLDKTTGDALKAVQLAKKLLGEMKLESEACQKIADDYRNLSSEAALEKPAKYTSRNTRIAVSAVLVGALNGIEKQLESTAKKAEGLVQALGGG
jgi:hypothetical protein